MILNHMFRKLAVTLVVIMALMPTIHANAQGSRYRLSITNDSAYNIRELYVSSSELTGWGPDLLGSRVLRSGETFTVTDITPGEYDIKFVDKDRDVCILRKVAVFENLSWRLTNAWLLSCEFPATR